MYLVERGGLQTYLVFIHKQELFFNESSQNALICVIMGCCAILPVQLCHVRRQVLFAASYSRAQEKGNINDGPVPIDQLFTAGNILEDSYKVEYL